MSVYGQEIKFIKIWYLCIRLVLWIWADCIHIEWWGPGKIQTQKGSIQREGGSLGGIQRDCMIVQSWSQRRQSPSRTECGQRCQRLQKWLQVSKWWLGKCGPTAEQGRRDSNTGKRLSYQLFSLPQTLPERLVLNNLTTQKSRDKAKARKMCL